MAEAEGYKGEKKTGAKSTTSSGVTKLIELRAESPKSWEHAVQLCVAEAVRTLRNIEEVQVVDFRTVVQDDTITAFRVLCRVSFAIDDTLRAH
jgi:hypothetical protein